MQPRVTQIVECEIKSQLLDLTNEIDDKAFYAVVKTHKRQSNKIYNSELTITKI